MSVHMRMRVWESGSCMHGHYVMSCSIAGSGGKFKLILEKIINVELHQMSVEATKVNASS